MEQKTATSVEQSKKLRELGLDTRAADMIWCEQGGNYVLSVIEAGTYPEGLFSDRNGYTYPAWSLSALLELMPHEINGDDDVPYRLLVTHKLVQYPRLTTLWPSLYSAEGATTIEAAYNMIIRLLENGYLKEK